MYVHAYTHICTQLQAAKLAQELSTLLFQGLYFAANSPEDDQQRHKVDVIVISLHPNGVIAYSLRQVVKQLVFFAKKELDYVFRFGIRGLVHLRDKHGMVVQPDPTSPDKVIFGPG